MRAAKAQALISGRDYVAPDDVQAVLPQTIAHRLVPVGDAGAARRGAGARHGGCGSARVMASTALPIRTGLAGTLVRPPPHFGGAFARVAGAPQTPPTPWS